MTPEQRDDLRRLAESARDSVVPYSERKHSEMARLTAEAHAHAAFEEAATPATILALLAESDALRARVARLEAALGWVLPMAKGYTRDHNVGRNVDIIMNAEDALAAADAGTPNGAAVAASPPMSLPEPWARVGQRECVECSRCGYTMALEHVDPSGKFDNTCPSCAFAGERDADEGAEGSVAGNTGIDSEGSHPTDGQSDSPTRASATPSAPSDADLRALAERALQAGAMEVHARWSAQERIKFRLPIGNDELVARVLAAWREERRGL